MELHDNQHFESEFFSHSIMHLRFLHDLPCIVVHFFIVKWYPIVWMIIVCSSIH